MRLFTWRRKSYKWLVETCRYALSFPYEPSFREVTVNVSAKVMVEGLAM
jgi:hypothetical protein